MLLLEFSQGSDEFMDGYLDAHCEVEDRSALIACACALKAYPRGLVESNREWHGYRSHLSQASKAKAPCKGTKCFEMLRCA